MTTVETTMHRMTKGGPEYQCDRCGDWFKEYQLQQGVETRGGYWGRPRVKILDLCESCFKEWEKHYV
jgi:hypothetical protein